MKTNRIRSITIEDVHAEGMVLGVSETKYASNDESAVLYSDSQASAWAYNKVLERKQHEFDLVNRFFVTVRTSSGSYKYTYSRDTK